MSAPELSELRLTSDNLSPQPSVVSFLSEVNDLKKLELHAVTCDIMEFFNQNNYTFGLKHLVLISTDFIGTVSNDYDHVFLQEFIKEHAATINTLEMRAFVSPWCLNFLVKKLRVLRFLLLKVNCLIPDLALYTNKKPRKSVKNLILEGPYTDLEIITAILTLYPSVKTLQLNDFNIDSTLDLWGEIVEKASEICLELLDLSVSRIPTFNKPLIFKKLETLRVGYVNDWNDLVSFLLYNNKVQTLHINYIFRYQADVVNLKRLLESSVRNLHITAEASEIKRIYEFIEMIGSGNLISLELIVQSQVPKSYNFYYSPGNTNTLTADRLLTDIHVMIIDELAEYLDDSEDCIPDVPI